MFYDSTRLTKAYDKSRASASGMIKTEWNGSPQMLALQYHYTSSVMDMQGLSVLRGEWSKVWWLPVLWWKLELNMYTLRLSI